MKLSVAKSGNPRYFTAKLGWKEQFDPKEIELLAAGAVPMLIPPMAVQGKHNNVMEFDVTPYSTLAFYLTCVLSREQFVELLEQFVRLFRRMQEVYLNYKNLALEFDQIFVSLQDRSIHLVYLPLRDSKRQASIPDFFRRLAKAVNHSTYEQVAFLNELNAFLDRPAPFTLNDLQLLLQGKSAAAAPVYSPPVPPPVQPGSVTPVVAPAVSPVPGPVPVSVSPVVPPPVSPAEPARDGERPKTYQPPLIVPVAQEEGTVILQDNGGTVILGAEEPPAPVAPPPPRAILTRVKTGEQAEAKGPLFRMGKESGQVHYCITDNNAVSRCHAELLLQEGSWWVRDLNSTNKTYLNGCALTPGEATKLTDGAALRLANEEFTVRIEG